MTERFEIRSTLTETDIDVVHRYLSEESYWSRGAPREVVVRSIANSLPFVVYDAASGSLAGFARVISDYATFAYLADVFVLPEYRGCGVSKQLMETILAHPDLQGLRRFLLFTRDAHTLYEQFGFTPLPDPAPVMQRHNPHPWVK